MSEEKAEETLEEKVASEQGSKSNRNRNMLLIGAGVIVLGCACLVVAIAAALIAFPDLLGRLFGGADPIARTLPAGTDFYVQVDLLKLADEDLSNIVNAFADAADDPDVSNTDDIIDQLDEEMQSSWGLTFTDDVKPWIGQYAAVAMTDFTLDNYGEPDPDALVFIVEARDTDATDTFVVALTDALEREEDYAFFQEDIDGLVVYAGQSDFGDTIAIARSGSLLYFTPSLDTLEEIISVESGDSLANDDVFSKTVSGLPNDRMLTLYMSNDAFTSVTQYAEEELFFDSSAFNTTPMEAYRGMGMSLTAASNRLQMDLSSTFDPEWFAENDLAPTNATPQADQFLSSMPPDTYILLSGAPLADNWELSRENLIETIGEREFDNAMQDVEDTLGVNLDTELLPLLDGHWALGVYESNDNYLADNLDAPLGVLFMALSSDGEGLSNITGEVAAFVSEEPYIDVNESTSGDMTIYELVDRDFNETALAFGSGNGALLVGTDYDVIESAYSNEDSLATNDRFLEFWNQVPGGSNPSIYVDVPALVNVMVGSGGAYPDDVRFLGPIEAVIMSATPYKNDSQTISFIVFLDVE